MQSKVIIHERELTLFMNYEYDEQYVEQELSKESDWYVEHGSLTPQNPLRPVMVLFFCKFSFRPRPYCRIVL